MHWRRVSDVSSELVGQNKALAVLRRSLVGRVVQKWERGASRITHVVWASSLLMF